MAPLIFHSPWFKFTYAKILYWDAITCNTNVSISMGTFGVREPANFTIFLFSILVINHPEFLLDHRGPASNYLS